MVTTIKIADIISPDPIDLVPNKVYNLLVKTDKGVKDIRCRIVSKSKNRILIFKLKQE